MSNKIFLAVFIVLFAASSIFAYLFYADSQKLQVEKARLIQENKSLENDNQSLSREVKRYKEKSRDLSSRLSSVNEELEQVQAEREDLEKKYQNAKEAKELLSDQVARLKSMKIKAVPSQVSVSSEGKGDTYWQDVLQKKAELEARVENLITQMGDMALKSKDLEAKNKDLSMQIGDLQKKEDELNRKINFNARTISILTKDLVREREDKRSVLAEINRLKGENSSLATELKLARKVQSDLEKTLKQTTDDKEILSRKVKDMAAILQEKSLSISSLQDQLSGAVSSAKKVIPSETKAVELPPIVVRSEPSSSVPTSMIGGKVLAVNDKDKFIIIDIGNSTGIKPGNRFTVLRNDKKIGIVEVIQTRADISACDIKDIKSGERIKEEDIVRLNP